MDGLKLKIDRAKMRAIAGERLDKETIVPLLSIPEESPLCDYLGSAARAVAKEVCGDRAYLWGAVGVDATPCEMNCKYCSLGEAWELITQKEQLTKEEIYQFTKAYEEDGVRWIVLRTTEFYSLDKLRLLIRNIRKAVAGKYEIGINAGEMDAALAAEIAGAGASFAYHSLRLGEGKDTLFAPKARVETLKAIGNSPLDLVYLVEPVGQEHTNEEIASIMQSVLDCGASVSGVMARVPVPGTPLGSIPQISARRLAQLIAVSRLVCGRAVADICVHPCNDLALAWGANVTVVERGAIPRDIGQHKTEWNDFSAADAIAAFQRNGYTVHQTGQNYAEENCS